MIESPVRESASHTFGALPVSGPIARSLIAMSYREPTPIQERAIPVLRQGKDVVGQAQTGTGKTAGFGIPLIETINIEDRSVQAIILVPTRELCLQVADELARLAAHTSVRVIPVYGGVGLGRQMQALQRGAQVVVGTPGRVEDLMQRGSLRLGNVRFLVLDEADRMLDVGFLPAIERILKRTPAARQTSLFSATIPPEVRGLAARHMREPVTIEVDPEHATVAEIEQRFERVPDADKLSALRAYLDEPSCYLALVFRRTTHKADRLARDLSRHGYKAAALHGRRSQSQRERVLADLKSGTLQVLVATDIAARGLDIPGLTHVFNYDLPDTPEMYVHRIGRTGRAGETGTAVALIAPEDEQALGTLQRYLARRAGSSPIATSGSRPSRNVPRGTGGEGRSRSGAPKAGSRSPAGNRANGGPVQRRGPSRSGDAHRGQPRNSPRES